MLTIRDGAVPPERPPGRPPSHTMPSPPFDVAPTPTDADLWEAECRLRQGQLDQASALVWEALLVKYPAAADFI